VALKLFSQHVKGGKEFLQAAKGVLVIPNIVKAGLGVRGEYGERAMRIGGKKLNIVALLLPRLDFGSALRRRILSSQVTLPSSSKLDFDTSVKISTINNQTFRRTGSNNLKSSRD